MLALDASTGKRIWHFQTVHHDLWDKDLPAAPSLVTITKDGKKIDAVAQTTKSGWIFLFERETGKPVYPIEERPVPVETDLIGEKLSPTQPIPTLPKPFVRQVLSEQELNDLVPDSSYQEIKSRLSRYKMVICLTHLLNRERLFFRDMMEAQNGEALPLIQQQEYYM